MGHLMIASTDFQSLATFPYSWRWTEERYNILPPEALKAIRPLTTEKSTEVWRYSAKFMQKSKRLGEPALTEALFPSTIRCDTFPVDAEPVRKWLKALPPGENPYVFFVWESRAAALVEWQVFCEYWDDFCYPSSDDNLIWPVDEEWALAYWHEEVFFFGRNAP